MCQLIQLSNQLTNEAYKPKGKLLKTANTTCRPLIHQKNTFLWFYASYAWRLKYIRYVCITCIKTKIHKIHTYNLRKTPKKCFPDGLKEHFLGFYASYTYVSYVF